MTSTGWRIASGAASSPPGASPRTTCSSAASPASNASSCRGTAAAIRLPPSALNYRANIDALKRSGVTDILSLSAVGSLQGDLPPGHFVIVDQFIDRTFAREKSFFGTGCVAHVSVAHPVCPRIGDAVEAAAQGAGLMHKRGGTYLTMEGPQFSTKAESELYRPGAAT
jgi:5'-methylthioadenosine phosphorylase